MVPVQSMDNTQIRSDLAALQSSFSSMSESIMQLVQQVSDLKCQLQPVTMNQQCDNSQADKSTLKMLPPTYANVVSNSIAESVKKAVAASMKDHIVSQNKSSVIVYGLPEQGHDAHDIIEVLKSLSINCVPVGSFRMGKRPADPSHDRPRPMKVILSNASDRNSVLSAANQLKKNKSYNRVNIVKFLSADELAIVKQVRARCEQLNRAAGAATGQNRFIVISGKIMEKSADGKLVLYKLPPTERVDVSATKPKNAARGSQVAP
jgi:hypothetical protein